VQRLLAMRAHRFPEDLLLRRSRSGEWSAAGLDWALRRTQVANLCDFIASLHQAKATHN